MTAQKRSRAEARRSDDGQEHVEWVHNAHDNRSTTREHSDALHDKRGHLVVRAWDMTSMQCSNPANPWREHRDEHIFSMFATGGNERLARRKTHTRRARKANLTTSHGQR